MAKTKRQTTKFLKRFPGPYGYYRSTDGVDDTFNVYCRSSRQDIISTYFWTQSPAYELIVRVVCAALSSLNSEYSDMCDRYAAPLNRLESRAFVAMYPGPYSIGKFASNGFQPGGWEVLCQSSGNSVIYIFDEVGRFIVAHIADVLNQNLAQWQEAANAKSVQKNG